MKRYKRTSYDLQSITHTTKHQVKRTRLRSGGELRCYGMVGSSVCTSGTRRDYLVAYILGILYLYLFYMIRKTTTSPKINKYNKHRHPFELSYHPSLFSLI